MCVHVCVHVHSTHMCKQGNQVIHNVMYVHVHGQDTEKDVGRSIVNRVRELNLVGIKWRNSAFSEGLLTWKLCVFIYSVRTET